MEIKGFNSKAVIFDSGEFKDRIGILLDYGVDDTFNVLLIDDINIHKNDDGQYSIIEGTVINTGRDSISEIKNIKAVDSGSIEEIYFNKMLQFLSDEQINDITKSILKDKIESDIDRILSVRKEANISVVDQVISKICEKYSEKLSKEFEDDFIEVMKREINRENLLDGEDIYSTFRWNLNNELQRAAGKYIETHNEEIGLLISDKIKEASGSISTELIISTVKQKLDIDSIIKGLINN